MKIIFMGSAEFGIPSLEYMMKMHQIVGIVSTPARPKGRGRKFEDSPIVQFAQKNKLFPIFTPQKLTDHAFIQELSMICADIFVVIAFRILPKEVFSLPPLGTVNVHASLLPKFRGPAPIHRAIEAGEDESGLTIFRIDEGIDTGEIIMQKKITIGNQETTPELYQTMSNAGAKLLIDALEAIESDSVQPIKQNHSEAGKAPKLRKEEGMIDWKLSSKCIFNKIRAFKPFPGTYTYLEGKRLGIEWASPIEKQSPQGMVPGSIISVSSESFDVCCGVGVLRVEKIKPEGKRGMSVHDFLLGKKIVEGTVFA